MTNPNTKTHWKKVVSDPRYLGEADFLPGEEKIGTIDHVVTAEDVVTTEGRSSKAVVHFKEPGLKPMILNVTRSKVIAKLAGSSYVEDWAGLQIQLFIQSGIRAFGEIVNAVRVRPFKPRVKPKPSTPAAPVCEACGKPIAAAYGHPAEWVATYTRGKYGRALCASCASEAAKQTDKVETEQSDKEGEGND